MTIFHRQTNPGAKWDRWAMQWKRECRSDRAASDRRPNACHYCRWGILALSPRLKRIHAEVDLTWTSIVHVIPLPGYHRRNENWDIGWSMNVNERWWTVMMLQPERARSNLIRLYSSSTYSFPKENYEWEIRIISLRHLARKKGPSAKFVLWTC